MKRSSSELIEGASKTGQRAARIANPVHAKKTGSEKTRKINLLTLDSLKIVGESARTTNMNNTRIRLILYRLGNPDWFSIVFNKDKRKSKFSMMNQGIGSTVID
jgi:hypothetical protein